MNETGSNESVNPSRRRFLAAATKAVAAVGASSLFVEDAARAQRRLRDGALDISVFSKCLQWLDYSGMAAITAEAGFDGVDLTVRQGGHVLPERVEEDLPMAVEAATKAGILATAAANERLSLVAARHGHFTLLLLLNPSTARATV